MGSNIFLADEAPTYPTGYGICLAMLVVFGIVWPSIYYFYLKRVNRKRGDLSVVQIHEQYTDHELAMMGDESPLFRYAT